MMSFFYYVLLHRQDLRFASLRFVSLCFVRVIIIIIIIIHVRVFVIYLLHAVYDTELLELKFICHFCLGERRTEPNAEVSSKLKTGLTRPKFNQNLRNNVV